MWYTHSHPNEPTTPGDPHGPSERSRPLLRATPPAPTWERARGEVDGVGVEELVGEEEGDDLYAGGAAVHEVPVEEVLCPRGAREPIGRGPRS